MEIFVFGIGAKHSEDVWQHYILMQMGLHAFFHLEY